MKKTFFHSLLKRFALLTLATGTLFATSVFLSSCGGGGGKSNGLRGIHMELYAGSSCQFIELEEPITKTSTTYRGFSSWGTETNRVNCVVSVDSVEYNADGDLDKMVFRIIFNPGYMVCNSDAFKSWWGIGLAFTGVSMRGVPEYTVTCTSGDGAKREGYFTVTDDETLDFEVTWPNGGSGSMRNDGTANPTGWAPPANGIVIINRG